MTKLLAEIGAFLSIELAERPQCPSRGLVARISTRLKTDFHCRVNVNSTGFTYQNKTFTFNASCSYNLLYFIYARKVRQIHARNLCKIHWTVEIHLKHLTSSLKFSTQVSLLGNEWVKLINDSFELTQ